jgi:hypothetical protein
MASCRGALPPAHAKLWHGACEAQLCRPLSGRVSAATVVVVGAVHFKDLEVAGHDNILVRQLRWEPSHCGGS